MKYVNLFEAKKGSPEELVELLDVLPVSETAKKISEEIISDLNNYYDNDINIPYDKSYTYQPEDEFLKPYILNIHFLPSNNDTNLGHCEENDIQIKYINKKCSNFASYGNRTKKIIRPLFNIIKHECSHFYLGQKDVEKCLYHTHPDGLKKYYNDRQEMVLHSREIFDDFAEDAPNWRTLPIERIENRLKNTIKYLQSHTNIHMPFGAALQKKYLTFIMNNYIKPNLQSNESKIIKFDKFNEDLAGPPLIAAPLGLFAMYYLCDRCKTPLMCPANVDACPRCEAKVRKVDEKEFMAALKNIIPSSDWEELKREHGIMKYGILPLNNLDHEEKSNNTYGHD